MALFYYLDRALFHRDYSLEALEGGHTPGMESKLKHHMVRAFLVHILDKVLHLALVEPVGVVMVVVAVVEPPF